MNAGLIASRYARALLLFATERQEEQRVYEDAGTLRQAVLEKGSIPDCVRNLSASMQQFLTLVIRNKRVEHLPAILHLYQVYYRKEKGITRARLVSAAEDPRLADRLSQLMRQQGCETIDFETEVDPDLIGGFILRVDDRQLDASVASQLKQVQKELEANIRKNRKNG